MIYGSAGALVSIILLLSYQGFVGMFHAAGTTLYGAVLAITVIAHLALAVPLIVLGFFLLRFEEWARSAAIMVFALNTLNLPLGTLLGVYGLWVLFQPETEPLFLDPHFRRKAAAHGRPEAPAAKVVHTKADLKSEPRP
jgi:hypothetical protein